MRRLILLLALLAAHAAWSSAGAHEWVNAAGQKIDANWIMDNPLTAYCCGPEDCEPVPGRVRYTAAGWTVRGLKGTIRMDKTYPSIDGRPWACRYTVDNTLRCLFLPRAGQ